MLLFDSYEVDMPQRYQAVRTLLANAADPVSFWTAGGARPAEFVFRAWALGPDATLYFTRAHGLRIRHHERHPPMPVPAMLCLVTQPTGLGRLTRREAHDVLGSQTLSMCDTRGDYDYGWSGAGSSISCQVPLHALGLVRADIAAAIPRLRLSPLYSFVRDHICDVVREAQSNAHLDATVYQATIDLVRALIVSAPTVEPRRVVDDDHALWMAVQTHVRRHVAHVELDETVIAAAIGVSAPRLRQIAGRNGVTIDVYVRQERTRRARADMYPQGRSQPLGGRAVLLSTAARWGFRDADDLLDALANSQHADQV